MICNPMLSLVYGGVFTEYIFRVLLIIIRVKKHKAAPLGGILE